MNRIYIFCISLVCLPFLASGQKLSALKKDALNEAIQLQEQTHQMCQQLWDFAETALKEHQSSQLLINSLQQEGFSIEKNIAGMPTAFIASYGSGTPIIGILAEYDALPGVGNAPVPQREARDDGVSSGHGCGHNLFGAASVHAAIALKRTMEKKNIKGTIKLFGTPAEETVVGKVYMAKEGVFDNLDAVLEWHPSDETGVTFLPTLAMNNFEVEFFGQAAHGAADPWNGRSALDAVEMMNFGVNLMREHVYPTTRMHYVIADGGGAPNVVPEYAKVWYYVRDTSRNNVEEHYNRILKIAEGAALATNTSHKVTLVTGVHQYNHNEPLLKALHQNLIIVGPPQFTEEEQNWAHELQEFTGKNTKGFHTGINEIPPDWKKRPVQGGSTDVAEVSFIAPTAGLIVATAPMGVPWHSWATTASHGTLAGFKGADVATRVLTLTGIDLLTNEKLRKEAKDYFIQQTGGKEYQSPLPQDQQVTLPARNP
ncbi:M20 family metallopeptidase [soil metagenome]